MGMTTLSEPSCALKPTPAMDLGTRYVEELAGQLRCFDRVILHGTLIDVAHPGALLVSMQQAGFRPREIRSPKSEVLTWHSQNQRGRYVWA